MLVVGEIVKVRSIWPIWKLKQIARAATRRPSHTGTHVSIPSIQISCFEEKRRHVRFVRNYNYHNARSSRKSDVQRLFCFVVSKSSQVIKYLLFIDNIVKNVNRRYCTLLLSRPLHCDMSNFGWFPPCRLCQCGLEIEYDITWYSMKR